MFTFLHLQTPGFTVKLGPNNGSCDSPIIRTGQAKHFQLMTDVCIMIFISI